MNIPGFSPASRVIAIQIQPDRAAAYDEGAVLAACEALKIHKPLISGFEMEAGEDDGPWVNLLFETEQPAKVWPLLQTAFYSANSLGDVLRISSMAMCSGDEGWDDYLLLYHYDPEMALDTLPAN